MKTTPRTAATVAVIVLLIWGAPASVWALMKLLTGTSEPLSDGFAATSSLFTGLALAGIVAGLYIQQQQIARSDELQRDAARLQALPVLLADLDRKIALKTEERNRASSVKNDFNPGYPKYLEQLKQESDELFATKAKIMKLLHDAARLDDA